MRHDPRSQCDQRDQRGAATVLVVAMLGVLLLVGAASGVVASIFVAHRKAQSAADLAALAGAATLADLVRSARDPCVVAAEVALANDATLASCSVEGREIVVEATVTGPRWLGQDTDPVAQARAGPSAS